MNSKTEELQKLAEYKGELEDIYNRISDAILETPILTEVHELQELRQKIACQALRIRKLLDDISKEERSN